MKTKTTFILLLLMTTLMSFCQNIDTEELRKMVLKSDVILASQNYTITNNYDNDYSIEQFYTINSIDTLIKNATQFKMTDKIRIQQQIDDYPAFWSERPEKLAKLNRIMEIGTRYTNLLFLKKENKQYKLSGIVAGIKWNDLTDDYISAIEQLMQIEKINNLNERYTKTIDWFIENNGYPDENFIAFYTKKGILQDNLILTEGQQQRAKENFLKGSNELRPFVDKETINAYSLKKLKEIRNSSNPDYWKFYDELYQLYNYDYDSIDHILRKQLYADCLYAYDKMDIMDYFIKKLEEEIESEK